VSDRAGCSEGGKTPALGTEAPSVARLYDYALGGKDNFAVDRVLFDQLTAVYPEYRAFAVANRSFLTRAVSGMAKAGVKQFLDLGAGIPTSPSVHETARAVEPDATVVYVDNDPVVLARCCALFARWPGITAVEHDLCDAEAVLSHPAVRGALDFTQPVGLLCVAALHFVDHERSLEVLSTYRDALVRGSLVAISVHTLDPDRDKPELRDEGEKIGAALSTSIIGRTPAQAAELFTGWTVQEPGIVDVAAYQPGETTAPLWCLAGVGRRS
jgi:S-adenosyl methyltransferase